MALQLRAKRSVFSTKLIGTLVAIAALLAQPFGALPLPVADAVGLPGSVVVNEFSSATGPEWIELFNTTAASIDMTGWYVKDETTTTKPLSGVITAGAFRDIDLGSGYLNNSGDTINIFDEANTLITSVAYGSSVGAALAGPTATQSAALTSDGAASWGLTVTSTRGISNTPAVALTPSLVPQDFATWDNSPTFQGFNVGFATHSFGEVSAVTVDVLRANGSHVIRTAGPDMLTFLSDATTPTQASAPFVVKPGTSDGLTGSAWWSGQTNLPWTTATKPVSVTISVTGEHGTQTVTNGSFQEGDNPAHPSYESMIPAQQSTNVVTATGQHSWLFNRDSSTSSPYELNGSAASVGTGSLYVKPIGANPTDKFVAENLTATSVASFNSIAYDFKIAGNGTPADANEFYLNVYTNIDNSTNYYDCRFDFAPSTGSISDFTTATFTKSNTPVNVQQRGSRIASCPATLAGMPTGSYIRAFAISLGDTTSGDAGLAGYFDKVVTSTNSLVTTYDFEPQPYVNNEAGSNFIGTDRYVRADLTADIASAVRVPGVAAEVRFNFDGVVDVNGIAGSQHLQAGQWPNATGDKQFRVKPSLPNGAYNVTAEYKVGAIWYPVTGTAATYAIDAPTASYVLPQSNQTFRPDDKVVRVKVDDEFNQFSRMVTRINSVNHEVVRSSCADEGNYVLCDVQNASLPAGQYTATTTTYTKANNRVDNIASPTFFIDTQRPEVTNLSVDNAIGGVVSSAMVISASASDDRAIESVNFYVTNPRADGQCTGNGTVIMGQRISSTSTDGKYRVTLNSSGLNGDYCVTAVSRDAAFSNSSVMHQKVVIDNTSPAMPTMLTPQNNSSINTNDFYFDWSDVADAVRYEMQNSTDPTVNSEGSFQNVMWTGDYQQVQPTESRARSVGANGTWYWQVRSIDAAGNASAWTEPWKMTIDMQAPDAPVLTLETSDGRLLTTDTRTNSLGIVAKWNQPSQDTVKYIYKYWNAIPGNQYKQGSPYTTEVGGTSQSGTFNQGEGVHYIQIVAVDSAGNESAGSNIFEIVYDTTAPVVEAGNDQTVEGLNATLQGGAEGAENVIWNKLSGPGGAEFTPIPESDNEQVSVSQAGTYVFRLAASDSAGNESFDDVTITFIEVQDPADEGSDDGGANGGPVTETGTTGVPAPPAAVVAANPTQPVALGTTFVAAVNGALATPEGDTDEEDSGDILGSSTTETKDDGDVAGATDKAGWSLGDMAWYWWVAGIMALVGLWLLFVAAIRRFRRDEA